MSDEVFVVDAVTVTYGSVLALSDVSMRVPRGGVTALIGPSGCGKSTLLRTFNRMNDLVAGARLTGTVLFDGRDIHAADVDLIDLRRRVGMVFQKPNAFPRSVYENVVYGPTLHGTRHGLDDLVEESLTRAGLWDEVKDDLGRSATELSGDFTIVLVTHDLGQAARVSDRTAFFIAHQHDDEGRHGELVEYGPTSEIFGSPADPRTAEYLASGRG